MWPVTLKLPGYTESYIVTFVDKYCATAEFFSSLKIKFKKNNNDNNIGNDTK